MNSQALLLNPIVSIWFVILIGIGIAAYFIWKEVRQGSRLLLWRIIAQVMVILALSGLFLRPSYRTLKSSAPILLLTKDYNKRIADSLLLRYPSLQSWRMVDAADFPSSKV